MSDNASGKTHRATSAGRRTSGIWSNATAMPLGAIFSRRFKKLENKSPIIAAAEIIAPVRKLKWTNGASVTVRTREKTIPRTVFDFPNNG